ETKNMTRTFLIATTLLLCFSCSETVKEIDNNPAAVKNTMDDVITRLYDQVPPEKYQSIDDAFMLDFLTEKEKKVLATQYQYFKVNVPVTVSLMRHVEQATIPFWMEESGFKRTGEK